jgi:hypothetical protein
MIQKQKTIVVEDKENEVTEKEEPLNATVLNYFYSHEGFNAPKREGEMDLNDELQSMQDLSAFNLFKKRQKKGKKHNEWRKDKIREDDIAQMDFLTKQLQRMRKKEDIVVTRRPVQRKQSNQQCQPLSLVPSNQESAYVTKASQPIEEEQSGPLSSSKDQNFTSPKNPLGVVGGN